MSYLAMESLDDEALLKKLLNNSTDEELKRYNLSKEIIAQTLNGLAKDEFWSNLLTILSYSLIVIISFLGNLLVCRVCLFRENRTTTNCLIASLAFSDLLMTLLNIPFNVVRLLMNNWIFGQFLCIAVPFIQVMAVYVSSFTMAVIAVHRWRTVMTPMNQSRTSCSPRMLLTVIAMTWLFSAIFSIPHCIYNRVEEIGSNIGTMQRCRAAYPEKYKKEISLCLTIEILLTQYITPLTLACLIYAKIGQIIAQQGKIQSLRGNQP